MRFARLFLGALVGSTVLLGLGFAGLAAADSSVACDKLSVSLSDDKNFYVFTAAASGDSSAITGYRFDFGDHQSYRFLFDTHSSQDRHNATIAHSYQKDGSYSVSVQVLTKIGGKTSTVASDHCKTNVSIGTAASSLPNTGAGNVAGVFVVTTIGGTVLYQLRLRRHRGA